MNDVQDFLACKDIQYRSFTLSTLHVNCHYTQQALLIHGGAKSQEIFEPLKKMLSQYQIGSLSFDCIGHGQSTGHLADSSLYKRTQQALHIIQHQKASINICIGVSMGAYNAIKLSQLLNLDTLILIVPAVYTPQAYDINFGDKFSQIIRHQNSWQNSDAWDILNQFKGNLLIISAENDEVIPSEIPQKLLESATQCKWKKHLMMQNTTHQGFIHHVFSSSHLKKRLLQQLKKCLSFV